MKNALFSKIIFGAIICAGLSPMAFQFKNSEITDSVLSGHSWLAWLLLGLAAALLLLYRHNLSKEQLLGLAIFLAIMPLAFSFSGEGVRMVFFPEHIPMAMAYWVIAVLPAVSFLRLGGAGERVRGEK